jgi:hypothetical protein
MSFYTYMHTRNDTNEVFYIGKGKGSRANWVHGRSKHWTNIAKKHGFSVFILSNWEKESDAFQHEKLLIKCFKDIGAPLINLTDGGDGPSGQKFSEEFKKQKSEWMKQRYANGLKSPKAMLGKRHSEDTKRKMSESHLSKNRKVSEETRKKMSLSAIGKDGTFGMLGKSHSNETKAKLSLAAKKQWEAKKMLSVH